MLCRDEQVETQVQFHAKRISKIALLHLICINITSVLPNQKMYKWVQIPKNERIFNRCYRQWSNTSSEQCILGFQVVIIMLCVCVQFAQGEYTSNGFDLNVMPVWSNNITGNGVVVSIIDDGKSYNLYCNKYSSDLQIESNVDFLDIITVEHCGIFWNSHKHKKFSL